MKGMVLLASPAVAGLLNTDYGIIGVLALYACFSEIHGHRQQPGQG